MATKNYYAVLGLTKGASPQDIKRAHRNLSIDYHPDLNPDDDTAADKFREVNEAYKVLSDAQQRKIYDNRSGLDLLRGVSSAVHEFWAQTFHVN